MSSLQMPKVDSSILSKKDKIVSDIEQEGGSATGYLINAIEDNVLEELILKIYMQILIILLKMCPQWMVMH